MLFQTPCYKVEETLRFDIAKLRENVFQEQLLEAEGDREALEQLQVKLSDLEDDYQELIRTLWEQDPRFRKLNEPAAYLSIEEIQRQLLKPYNALMLEYFYGKEQIYLLGIGPEKSFIYTIPNNAAFQKELTGFLSYFQNANASLSDPSGYFTAAHELYASLFPASIQDALEMADRLLIIPDGPLGNIPFEAMLTEPYSGSGFGKAPYLLKKVPVQYAWSVELLWASSSEADGPFLQFDPQFLKGQRGLSMLELGQVETASLSHLDHRVGEAANMNAFLTEAPSARLLHLSTHASAGGEQEPRIEFHDETLSLAQLYALLLSTDLVVLSACETNLGQVARGEGILSLARGFTYAGAASLISTQWKVNERSTADILAMFYQKAKNRSKLEALHQAKLEYLENRPGPGMDSPYYWAGLSYYGQDGKLFEGRKIWPWILLLGALFAIFFIFFRNRG